ncbi:MAG TPA: YHS domain-containing (seleno)protein [Afipia sp.]
MAASAAFLALPFILQCSGYAALAAFTERMVVDRNTGLAISGYDPVAYFTDGSAIAGQEAFEASQGGAVWRFANEANRAFFLASPDIYAPQFGGYDPVDLVRGNIVAGRAQNFLIAERRLYLFNRADTKDAFAADPTRIAREAADRWPALRDTLSDY